VDEESLSPVLAQISRLLVQAEKTSDAASRAAAVRQLWVIHAKLESDLQEAERDIRAGINRRVEAIAYRATLATLGTELALMGEHKPPSP
jgi:hypothetical protein